MASVNLITKAPYNRLPEEAALRSALAMELEINALESELADNQPLLNQLKLLKVNLQSSRQYLLATEHSIAFIGSVGVGKTTAICKMLGLLDDKGEPVLSTSSGRTTLCEVEIRGGTRTRILITPCSAEETSSFLQDFADVLEMRHQGRASEGEGTVSLSAEVERCLRNMLGLPTRRSKNPDGTMVKTDDAMELFVKLGSAEKFLAQAMNRIKLDARTTTELVCNGDDPLDWLKNNFSQVNHGRNPETPMPMRITIELAKPLFGLADLNISIIDTKGLDGNVEREDIDRQFRDTRTCAVICSKFNDAPEQSVQDLLKHLLDSGLAQQIARETHLVILDRSEESQQVISEEGPVGSAEEGRLVRQDQIQDTLRARLKVADHHFPRIGFFNASKDTAHSISEELLRGVCGMRQRRVKQITEIGAAVEEIAKHREKAQAKAAFDTVSRAVSSWAQASRQRLADIRHVYKSLVDDLTTKEVYASSIRASVNRKGSWGNFDFYYKLAVAARKKTVTSFGEAVGEIRLVLTNFERQKELKAAHPFIRQLQRAVDERMERLYETASATGRNAFECDMKSDGAFWSQQQDQWGRGPGYKSRVAQGTESWFHHHSPAKSDAQIQQVVMAHWKELIDEAESLLTNTSICG